MTDEIDKLTAQVGKAAEALRNRYWVLGTAIAVGTALIAFIAYARSDALPVAIAIACIAVASIGISCLAKHSERDLLRKRIEDKIKDLPKAS